VGRRRIPRAAIADLAEMCKFLGKLDNEPPAKPLKRYLGLMEKYDDYFFDVPWRMEYDFEKATTFTDTDQTFLFANEEELQDRLATVCLKKNIYVKGFMGIWGMYWTEQAYHKQFVRPKLKPVSDAFLKYAEGSDDAQEVLGKLKSEFHDVDFIHDGLINYLETNYLDKQKDKLLTKILEVIHTLEGLRECNAYRCRLQREKLKLEAPSTGHTL
jgi:hypothetical protein